jgi:hypothetical protein
LHNRIPYRLKFTEWLQQVFAGLLRSSGSSQNKSEIYKNTIPYIPLVEKI